MTGLIVLLDLTDQPSIFSQGKHMTSPLDVTTFITAAFISKAQDIVVDKVINKWKSYRANKFFEVMIQEIATEYSSQIQNHTLDEILEKILTKSNSEEVLYEAYRRVCLSTSKDLGPKIIALLTARLLIEDRNATEDEESIFILAEEMLDVELMDFCTFFISEGLEAKLLEGNYSHSISSETLDLSSSNRTSTTHLTPTVMLGKWAEKLERVGFLYADTISENYMETNFENERNPVIAYHFYVNFEKILIPFYHYVRRAQGPSN